MTHHYLQLILYKAYADLKVEAARGYMGMFWWIVEPVLYMGAFYIIFGIALERGGSGFVPYLLTGLVAWKWFDSSVRMAANSISMGKGLMSQVYLPKYFFPSVIVLRNTAKFSIVFALLLVFILLSETSLNLTWLALPVVLLIQLMLILAVSFFLSSIIPLWPDLMLVVNNGLMLMFFLSGIFFDLSKVGGVLGQILDLNPMVHVINGYRQILLYGGWPDWSALGIVAFFALVIAWIGLTLLRKYNRLYPRLL